MNIPSWTIEGVVVETRELTTDKGTTKGQPRRVWAYSIKIMAMGGTFEVQTRDEEQYKSIGEGQQVHASGHFDTSGQLRLQLDEIRAGKLKAAS